MTRWETDSDHRFTKVSCYEGLIRDDEGRGVAFAYSELGRTRWEVADADPEDLLWKAHIADLNAHRPFSNFSYLVRIRSGRLVRAHTSGRPKFKNNKFVGYSGTGYFTRVTPWIQQIAG
jgi:hypothetical protein